MTPQEIANHLDPFMDECKRDGQMVVCVLFTPGPEDSEDDDFMCTSNLTMESALIMLRRFLGARYVGDADTGKVRES